MFLWRQMSVNVYLDMGVCVCARVHLYASAWGDGSVIIVSLGIYQHLFSVFCDKIKWIYIGMKLKFLPQN